MVSNLLAAQWQKKVAKILRFIIYYSVGHMFITCALIVIETAYAGSRILFYVYVSFPLLCCACVLFLPDLSISLQMAFFVSIAIILLFFSVVLVFSGVLILRILRSGVAKKSERRMKTERNITVLMISAVIGFVILCLTGIVNLLPDHTIASVRELSLSPGWLPS